MSRPDLETEEGRAAYRKELRRVAWPLRWGGLALIVAAALLLLAARNGTIGPMQGALNLSYIMLGVGWICVLAAIWMRTQHHKRRLSEGL